MYCRKLNLYKENVMLLCYVRDPFKMIPLFWLIYNVYQWYKGRIYEFIDSAPFHILCPVLHISFPNMSMTMLYIIALTRTFHNEGSESLQQQSWLECDAGQRKTFSRSCHLQLCRRCIRCMVELMFGTLVTFSGVLGLLPCVGIGLQCQLSSHLGRCQHGCLYLEEKNGVCF